MPPRARANSKKGGGAVQEAAADADSSADGTAWRYSASGLYAVEAAATTTARRPVRPLKLAAVCCLIGALGALTLLLLRIEVPAAPAAAEPAGGGGGGGEHTSGEGQFCGPVGAEHLSELPMRGMHVLQVARTAALPLSRGCVWVGVGECKV